MDSIFAHNILDEVEHKYYNLKALNIDVAKGSLYHSQYLLQY